MTTDQPIPVLELFNLQRIPSSMTKLLLVLYFPIGITLFVLRLFIGLHTFIVSSLLRKASAVRSIVLRTMCTVLGIVVTSKGERDLSVKMIVSNHQTVLDHLAVDMLAPCVFPSVWDIPEILRWCFGYADLGASVSRAELVRQAKEHVAVEDNFPLLAFPERAMTSGRRALLKFSSWPCEVSSRVQPVALSIWRPFDVRVSLLTSTWWSDVLWFFALPFSVISIRWLEPMEQAQNESADEFSARVENAIAEALGVAVSNLTSQDATDALKRELHQQRTATVAAASRSAPLDPRRRDEVAMRIKQAHPTIPLYAIRTDLDKTKSQQETTNRIRSGALTAYSAKGAYVKSTANPEDWKKLYGQRKWEMIEQNRAKYLERAKEDNMQDNNEATSSVTVAE